MTSHLALLLVLQTAPLTTPQELALDSAHVEVEQGRYWHAARLLWSAFPEGPQERDSLTMLFARAEAGWSNWPEVKALLEGPLETGELEDQRAWYLLGRALESEERWPEAGEAYARAMDMGGGLGLEARARRARARARMDLFEESLDDLEVVARDDPTLGGWAALQVAEWAAGDGAREETRLALGLVADPEVRSLGWSYPARSLLASGDSAGAEAAYWSALPSLASEGDQASAWDRVGVLRLARGDSVGARGAFHQVLSLGSSGTAASRAGRTLLGLGFDLPEAGLTAARALAGQGQNREALDAYEEYEGLLGGVPSPVVRLAKAGVQLAVGDGRGALALATELGEAETPELGAPALALAVRALRGLGRGGEARAFEDSLVARFPQRAEAVEILFLRGDALQTRGDLEGALGRYAETAALAPSENRAGQARMRTGQILQSLGREEEAVDVYSAYLSEFPDGRRWDEAAYWAGRILLATGQEAAGQELLSRLQTQLPLSYYSVRAAEELGQAFDPSIPALPDSLPLPAFLRVGLERVDNLGAAGLSEGADWEVERLARRIRGVEDTRQRQDGLLRLAKELNLRGFTREGINLGFELRRDGRPWDRDLLSAVYPFPYRELVALAARDREVDPFLMAGLIRQESAFWVEARSRADARGLMQVLPSTGRELARAVGPRGFRPDDHLFEAEINIHLGTKFFFDMRQRFGGDLPIILSAYNAGPTRALRWREFPEVRDMPRFVERIPFTETRGYVKNVLLNQAIYSWLYGNDSQKRDPNGSRPS